MSQNTKPFRKDALCNFFPVAESTAKKKPEAKNVSINQNKQQNPMNTLTTEKTPVNKPSVEKAVYTTQTQEISFEKFLKSKHKKP